MNVNFAMFRTLDASIGRWWQVDPKADHDYSGTPYNSMYNNPILETDPDGDCPVCIVGVAAAIGGVANAYIQKGQGSDNFWGDFAQGAFIAGSAAYGAPTVFAGAFYGATALGSSYLPSANIPLGNNFSLSISPMLAFGSAGWNVGVNIGVNYSDENFSAGVNLGVGYGKFNATKQKGFFNNIGGGVRFGGENGFLALSTNKFNSGFSSQRTGGISFGGKNWSVDYENDENFIPGWGDGGDRFRTTAIRASVKDYSFGTYLVTGDPGVKNRRSVPGTNWYRERHASSRLGALYVGYKNNLVGWNSPGIRKAIQGTIHDLGGWRHFKYGVGKAGPFFQYANKNPYTLW